MDSSYHFGLLYLCHLIVGADGFVSEKELAELKVIKENENISESEFDQFKKEIEGRNEREIYQLGLKKGEECSRDQKLDIFAILYRLSEADNHVHVKEIRLLLYSIKDAGGISFDEIVCGPDRRSRTAWEASPGTLRLDWEGRARAHIHVGSHRRGRRPRPPLSRACT